MPGYATTLRAVLGQSWPAGVTPRSLIAIAERFVRIEADRAFDRWRARAEQDAEARRAERNRISRCVGQRRRRGTAHLTDEQYERYRVLIVNRYTHAEAIKMVDQ